jgi:hypothetical protein
LLFAATLSETETVLVPVFPQRRSKGLAGRYDQVVNVLKIADKRLSDRKRFEPMARRDMP